MQPQKAQTAATTDEGPAPTPREGLNRLLERLAFPFPVVESQLRFDQHQVSTQMSYRSHNFPRWGWVTPARGTKAVRLRRSMGLGREGSAKMTEMTKTHKSESEIARLPVINGLHQD